MGKWERMVFMEGKKKRCGAGFAEIRREREKRIERGMRQLKRKNGYRKKEKLINSLKSKKREKKDTETEMQTVRKFISKEPTDTRKKR